MPSDPVEAGRKGGRSRSLKKLLAARRNGFQRQSPKPLEGQMPQQPLISAEEQQRASSENA